MKNFIFLIISIIIFSCNNDKSKATTQKKDEPCVYPDILLEPNPKTTALGFKFGSNVDEFESRYYTLQDEKKIFNGYDGKEYYIFDIEGLRETFFRINAQFYNDSLSSIYLKAESHSTLSDFQILSKMLEIKYGKPYCSKKDYSIWVNNNIGITLSIRSSEILNKDFTELNYEQISYQTRSLKNFIKLKGDTTITNSYGYPATYDLDYFKKHVQSQLNKSSIKDL